MKVCFKNDKDKAFYEDYKGLSIKYGQQTARKIVQRIIELREAINPQKLPKNSNFHQHGGQREGLFSVDLNQPFRLIVLPKCDYVHYFEITDIQIYEVYNAHK